MVRHLVFILCSMFFIQVIGQNHLNGQILICNETPETPFFYQEKNISYFSSVSNQSEICEEQNYCGTQNPSVISKFEMKTPPLKKASNDWSDVPGTEPPNYFKQNLNLIMEETSAEKEFWQHFGDEGRAFCRDVVMDYKHYYSVWNGIRFLIALGIAAPLANTEADMDIHEWYQDKVRSSGSDDFAAFWKNFGEGKILLPLAGGLTLMAFATDENLGWMDQVVGEYGKNLARSYLVGAIPVLVMQNVLGADRPIYGSTRWTPFEHEHGVSGHAFVGAVPFIMAAKMTDRIWLKVLFYTCSTLPAWSRMNDGMHSLSQVGLGWFIAYMACDAVAETNHTRVANYAFTPIFSGDTIGVNFMIRF